MTLSKAQNKILKAIDPHAGVADWTDWKWQMRNSIRDLATYEALLGLELSHEQREAFTQTAAKISDVHHSVLSLAHQYRRHGE